MRESSPPPEIEAQKTYDRETAIQLLRSDYQTTETVPHVHYPFEICISDESTIEQLENFPESVTVEMTSKVISEQTEDSPGKIEPTGFTVSGITDLQQVADVLEGHMMSARPSLSDDGTLSLFLYFDTY